MESGEGLGEVWEETQSALLETIPLYDRGNRLISFGRDTQYRREGILRTVRSGDAVLDLGCGPGTMSRITLGSNKEAGELVLADPLKPMLEAARANVSGNPVSRVSGLFEHLPFRDGVFDVVMCGFSFRDARSYRSAVGDIARVLKKNGRFLIVDLGKPDGRLHRWVIGLYFRFAAGLLTFLVLGRRGLVFSKIYPTYLKYPTVSRIRELLEERFEAVTVEARMMGGVIIALAEKPKAL